MMRWCVGVMLVGVLVARPSFAQREGSGEQAILNAFRALESARNQKDSAAMDRRMTSDYSYVHSNGAMHTTTEEIAEALASQPRSAMSLADSLHVRVYGDAAVITGVYFMNARGGGKSMRRFTATWVMREGRWQQASGQSAVVSQG